ncbi:MAG: biopolymer transporter ExbD [Agriterribacter sp.]
MANIDSTISTKKEQKGIVRHSIRVDMTPMVDLGFLLITFFIFSTVMTKPMAMKLIMPVEDGPDTPSAETKTLTLLLKEGGNVVCYEGFAKDNTTPKKINLDGEINSLRNIIQQKTAALSSHIKPDTLTVIIKPTMESDYNTLVKAMDEMSINNVHKYAIAQLDDDDKKLLDITH